MAIPTAVNGQITGAASPSGLCAMALGMLYQSMAQAMAMAAFNATQAQQQACMTHQATTTACVLALLR
ncbi:hypothetical protein WV31_19365 [Magnetospirillum sp. ME-1]|uniref:RebB family R body protein n=1 Tax=Magnetospirillum sp. ME-1 TaxID=1639348 RepID=UPI000A17B7D2|nr:RebB family R body protein [Magnetospirillum sp. ME-1]ARJ67659.1 hypothetical protein WV31_19365 [Magnetospirillum sp. ME-1]